MEKIAMITGATAGIGKACAIKLAQNGYHLILTGRRTELLETLKQELESTYSINTQLLNFDVRQKEEVQKHIKQLPQAWKKIDLLINNAGLALDLTPIQDGDINDWETMIDTNVKGLLYVSKEVMPLMMAQQKGHIINIGSIAGKETYPNNNAYCATKHAVDSLTKTMRMDLVSYGIKVTAIHPGAVDTEFSIVRYKGDKEKANNTYKGFTPLYAEDIADAIYYCCQLPSHVNINDMVIMPTAQASAGIIHKEL